MKFLSKYGFAIFLYIAWTAIIATGGVIIYNVETTTKPRQARLRQEYQDCRAKYLKQGFLPWESRLKCGYRLGTHVEP